MQPCNSTLPHLLALSPPPLRFECLLQNYFAEGKCREKSNACIMFLIAPFINFILDLFKVAKNVVTKKEKKEIKT